MYVDLIASVTDVYKKDASEADAARLDFFQGLYEHEQHLSEAFAAAHPYERPSREDEESWYWAYSPVLQHNPVTIDGVSFAAVVAELAGYIAEHAGLEPAAAQALTAYDWREFANTADLTLAGSNPPQFLENTLTHLDVFGVPTDIAAPVFASVLSATLRVFLQPAAEAIMAQAPRDQTNHDRPLDCPVCGMPAAASFVGQSAGTDGNGRMQYCSLCGAEWDFERIRCGNCGTQQQNKLHYFNVEGDNGHRLQSCDACGDYSRVVFQADIPGPLCMEVEDVVMAKLDRIALDPRFRTEAQPKRTK